MPQIEDILKNREKKPFVKKEYRAWDLTGTQNVTETTPEANDPISIEVGSPTEQEKTSEPISNQLVTKLEPKGNQKVTKLESISNQSVTKNSAKVINKEPISNHTSNQNRESNSNQIVTELVTNNEAKIAIKKLVGLQKTILFYVVEQCVAEGNLVAGPITNEVLRLIAKTDADTIKTAVQRLINKRLIQRVEGKRGRGGFAYFSINTDIRTAMLEEKKHVGISNQLVTEKVTSISNQLVINKEPYKEPNASSSSSNINNLITTTTELSPEWEEVDLSELHHRNIRLGKGHIAKHWDILKNYSAFDFQESINGFVFDIDHGYFKPRTSPLNFLLGVIQNGGLYNPSEHYISPERERIKQMLADAEKRKEEAFLVWLEVNRSEIQKYLNKFEFSYSIAFQHSEKSSIEWVKKHLYETGKLQALLIKEESNG